MKEAILRGDLAAYARILERSWEAKKRLASAVSNPKLDAIYTEAMEAGALAGKISGAGGGGFFMFYVPPSRRMAVLRRLCNFEGEVMNFHFTSVGAQSWMIEGDAPQGR
jgi:D-glycero-alpha-D-manno-heptose-7-phosphate kinase